MPVADDRVLVASYPAVAYLRDAGHRVLKGRLTNMGIVAGLRGMLTQSGAPLNQSLATELAEMAGMLGRRRYRTTPTAVEDSEGGPIGRLQSPATKALPKDSVTCLNLLAVDWACNKLVIEPSLVQKYQQGLGRCLAMAVGGGQTHADSEWLPLPDALLSAEDMDLARVVDPSRAKELDRAGKRSKPEPADDGVGYVGRLMGRLAAVNPEGGL